MDDCLRRHGWDGKEAVATTIATIDVASGVIRGMRYETRGAINDLSFKAKDLWPDSDPGIKAIIKFNNLSVLT